MLDIKRKTKRKTEILMSFHVCSYLLNFFMSEKVELFFVSVYYEAHTNDLEADFNIWLTIEKSETYWNFSYNKLFEPQAFSKDFGR